MKSRNTRTRLVGALGAILMLTAIARAQAPAPSAATSAKIAADVRKAILRLPYYGVFDLVSFEVNGGQVTLGGYAYRGALKEEAEKAVAKIPGVTGVENGIQVLPTSIDDDRIRSAAFRGIYTDDFLSRYGTPVAGGVGGGFGPLFAGRRLWGSRFGFGGPRAFRTGGLGRAPLLGMEPLGNYAIHIIVNRGNVDLYGVVDNDVDKTKAGMDIRQILGVHAVNNDLQVVSEKSRPKA